MQPNPHGERLFFDRAFGKRQGPRQHFYVRRREFLTAGALKLSRLPGRFTLSVIPDVLTGAIAASLRDESAERVGALFDAHHQRLYRLARRLTASHEDARDVVQDTFLRAAQRITSVPSGASSEEAWLVRVLVNICRDRWRQRTRRARLDAAALPPATSGRSDEAALVARDTVWQAIERLPMKRRAALVMFELEGATVAEIASTLGMNPITVRWHLSRGRRELAQLIRETKTHG